MGGGCEGGRGRARLRPSGARSSRGINALPPTRVIFHPTYRRTPGAVGSYPNSGLMSVKHGHDELQQPPRAAFTGPGERTKAAEYYGSSQAVLFEGARP